MHVKSLYPLLYGDGAFRFNGLWTFWIISGTFQEERDLISSFGDAYRSYQRKVPMLIPYRWFPWNHHQQQQ